MKLLITLVLICGVQVPAVSQHQSGVEKRGDQAMGFPHDKTTHHFRLYSDGGAIEVTANDAKHSADIQAIRSHLEHIAGMFADGDFSMPMFIHDQVPPGVQVMKEKRKHISYKYEEIPSGARVRIKTANQDALKAIHEFLRFQIEDHHTGDKMEVSQRSPQQETIAHRNRRLILTPPA
jgi:hypothetical protein